MVSPLLRETPEGTLAEARARDAFSPALRRLRSSLPQELRLVSARELSRSLRDEAEEHPPFRTAVPALDRLLDGGLPRGHLVELIGGRSSGRFSTLLAALAAVTGAGEAAALVDLGDGLDPAVAESMGMDLARLLWLRPTDLKQALAGTEMLLGAGFPLVALDLGNPPVRGGRGVEAVWLRLARTARSHGAALLVGSPYRVSGTAAGAVLKAGRARAVWQGGEGSPWLLGGFTSHLEIEKHRGRLPGQSENLELALSETPLPSAKPVAPARPQPRPEPRELPEVWDMPLRAVGGRR